MKKHLLLTLLAGALFVGFAPTATAQNAKSEAVTYTVDSVHSGVLFKIQHLGAGMVYGQFLDFSGSVAESATGLDVKFEVKTASVFTNNKQRDDHLRSPDFFNAKEFPTLKLETTSSKKIGKKFQVVGNITLHGVTKEVLITVEPTGTGKGMKGEVLKGYHTEFTIKRSDFGMNFMQDGALGDNVKVIIAVEAAK